MSNHAPARVIRKADRRAQRRLHRVFLENTYTDPNHPLTLLYHEAERLLDRLKGEPEPRWAWEAAEERAYVMGGEYVAVGLSLPDVPLADPGDITVFPMGVGR